MSLLKGIMTFYSQTVHAFLVNKKVNFNENETHAFRGTSLALQLMRESRTEKKVVISWGS